MAVKEVGAVGVACGLVVGTYFFAGLVHERDQLRATLGAERPTPTATVTASPTTNPATNPAAAPPQASPSPSAAPVVQAAAANPGQGPIPGPVSTPPSPPASPAPTTLPPRCADAAAVTLRLPARALSCNAVIVGGSG